ncbi:hypothetical protein Pfl04_47080 [Planosporangium flavigriseum]|uniref:Uncharacterized protein n=1 Tax=Planosporangium flavigriseum TaxID=373681 RepID=A0A8J3LRI8_9ACTN|nr:hypothetical protein Pfl04_47080 [Planosporangium flavigriseum]
MPSATAPPRTGNGSRKIGRGGPPGNSPVVVRIMRVPGGWSGGHDDGRPVPGPAALSFMSLFTASQPIVATKSQGGGQRWQDERVSRRLRRVLAAGLLLTAVASGCGGPGGSYLTVSCGRRTRSRNRIHRASTPSFQVIFLPSSRVRAR